MFRIFRYFIIGILLLLPTSSHASVNNIVEEDGSHSVYPWKLKFPNGSLTVNPDGSVSVALGGAELDPLSWSIASDQTLLTGDKSGSFDLTTTGTTKLCDTNIGQGIDVGAGVDGKFLKIWRVDMSAFAIDYMQLYINSSRQMIWTGYGDMIIGPNVNGASAKGKDMTVIGGLGGQAAVGAGGDTYIKGGNAGGSGGGTAAGGNVYIQGGTGTGGGANGTVVINGNVSGTTHKWVISIKNGNSAITSPYIIGLDTTNAAITITSIKVTTSSAAYEIAGDLKWADARIGLASAAVLHAFDTTSGVFDSGAETLTVASGKFVYLVFDAAPNASDTDDLITIEWDYD